MKNCEFWELFLIFKVKWDIHEIKILYLFGENLLKNEFSKPHTSKNSQNTKFFVKKLRSYSKKSIPISLILQPTWDILEIKILCKFGETSSKNELFREHISNNYENSHFFVKQNFTFK